MLDVNVTKIWDLVVIGMMIDVYKNNKDLRFDCDRNDDRCLSE